MNTFKTYQKVNPKKDNVTFAVSRMEDIYTKHNGKADEPHRHNYFTVLIVKKAAGQHSLDFNTYELSDHQIFISFSLFFIFQSAVSLRIFV